jgi:hypothetical protein
VHFFVVGTQLQPTRNELLSKIRGMLKTLELQVTHDNCIQAILDPSKFAADDPVSYSSRILQRLQKLSSDLCHVMHRQRAKMTQLQ